MGSKSRLHQIAGDLFLPCARNDFLFAIIRGQSRRDNEAVLGRPEFDCCADLRRPSLSPKHRMGSNSGFRRQWIRHADSIVLVDCKTGREVDILEMNQSSALKFATIIDDAIHAVAARHVMLDRAAQGRWAKYLEGFSWAFFWSLKRRELGVLGAWRAHGQFECAGTCVDP